MKSICIAFSLVLTVWSATMVVTSLQDVYPVEHNFDSDFANYKLKFSKNYASPAEEAVARKAYEENMMMAMELSKMNPLASFGENVFADIPLEAFQASHSNLALPGKTRNPIDYRSEAGGRAIDWRTQGAVTPVKDQFNCGSCWSFATTGNIESRWFLAGNPLTSLSEQELVSCDLIGPNNNNGCKGGNAIWAFEWLINERDGTIVTESSYPYVSGNGQVPQCNLNNSATGAQIAAYHDIPSNESQIAAHVYHGGPVAIILQGTSLHLYQEGIMTYCFFNNSQFHAVLIVGFDDNYGTPYWIIKNSWGVVWGESGYFRLAKGANLCGLDTSPVTAIVDPTANRRRNSAPINQLP